MAMRYQPQGLLRIDQGHPLAAGLRMAMLPGVNRGFDVGGMRSATPTGLKQVGSSLGMAAGFGSAMGAGTSDKIVTGLSGAFPATGRSYFFRARRNGAGGGNLGRLFDKTNGASGQFLMWYNADARINYGFYLNGGATEVNIAAPGSGATAAIGTAFDILVTHQFVGNTHIVLIYVNGVLVVTDSSRTTALVDAPTTPLTIGNRASDNARGWDGLIACAYEWDRVVSPDEAPALSANPYQLFADPNDWDDAVAAVLSSYKLTADAGTFALAAPAAALRASRAMPASAGVFEVGGAPVFFLTARRLPAPAVAFGLTGAPASIAASRRLAAGPGAFGLVGPGVGLRATRRLAAPSGEFVLGPTAAQMIYQPAADPGAGLPKYTLAAAPGAFGVVGSSAALRARRQFQAAAGVFLLAGRDARLAAERRLHGGAGALALAGTSAGLLAARRMPAQTATFGLSGAPAQLRYSAQIEYARAPTGPGYAPHQYYNERRPVATSSPRPAATQRNCR